MSQPVEIERGTETAHRAIGRGAGERRSTARSRRRFDVVGALSAMALSTVFAAWALRLWNADLAVPLRYNPVDDTKFYLMLVKGILTHGWYQTNPSLGAPFGQQLYDFPQGPDNLNLVLIKGLGLFSSNPALVANLFFLASFGLTALTAYAVARELGVWRWPAVVGAVIFSLLPYHFYRGESHLLLSAYYSVPLACYLFLQLIRREALFARRRDGRRGALGWFSARSAATVAMCLVIGSANLYYAVFAMVILMIATPIATLAGRRASTLGTGAGVVALIAATLTLNLAPSLIYQARHGGNAAISRTALESEELGLKLTDLVLPVIDHRLPLLSHANTNYARAVQPGFCEGCFATLGTVGDVGFVWLLVCGLVAMVGGAAWIGSQRLYREAAAGVVIAFVVGTIGGISGLVAFLLTPDIRGWNRISVFIAFFSLLASALLLQAAVRRLSERRNGRLWAGLLVAFTLLFGVWDETSDYFLQSYPATAQEWHSDEAFVAAIERRLPAGASVFQLPYVPFPEGYGAGSQGASLASPTIGTSYELLRGYLHSKDLRWSYGAMKGRPANWASQLASKPLGLVLPAVVAAGFSGLYVDPRGYPGPAAGETRATLESLLGVQPLLSRDRDLWFFDLRPYAARLHSSHTPAELAALRRATLHPLVVSCKPGRLELENPYGSSAKATLSALLGDEAGAEGLIAVRPPAGPTSYVPLSGGSARLEAQVAVPPGKSTIRLFVRGRVTPGQPQPVLPVVPQISQATLTSGAFGAFAAGPAALTAAPPSGITAAPCPI